MSKLFSKKYFSMVIPNFFEFQSLGKIKENFLIIFGLVYGVGYLSWSFYATINSLGIVPAFDLQYIIAGIYPSLLILFFIWMFKLRKRLIIYQDKNLNRKAVGKFKFLRIFFIALPYILVVIAGLLAVLLGDNDKWDNVNVAALVFVYIIVSLYILALSWQPSDVNIIWMITFPLSFLKKFIGSYRYAKYFRIVNKIARVYLQSILTFFFIILTLIAFYGYIYPNIPQEMGGVKPKRCLLISDKNIFKLQDFTPKDKSTIHQFREIDTIYYYNSNILIYKKGDTTVEINRGAVQNIFWLN
jgi:hypothetical protein